MSVIAIILLILLGLLLLLIEFAVIPGITIAGIGGFVLLGASVYIAFVQYGTGIGFLTLAVVLVLAPLMIYYFFKSKSGKKMILENKISGKVDLVDNKKIAAGDFGKTIGRLAPMGKIKVNGQVVEAQSTGIMIDPKTDVRILKVESNKVIVEPVKNI